jgi:regulator of cell morphogenesis and NO signaling
MQYLKASHEYYLGFQLPFIRKELVESLDENDNLARLIIKLYDDYARSIKSHMKYEERTVFPYVEALLNDGTTGDYDIETYSKHHGQTNVLLRELKSIIIKYLPSDGLHNNQLSSCLYDIYNNEEWLQLHAEVEDHIFTPAISRMEQRLKQSDVTKNISSMVFKGGVDSGEALSERERDVVIGVVQGLQNKEIAERLYISVNTVITHRRNIAHKLQIHSPAGLTIYAIVNGLVDISSVKL